MSSSVRPLHDHRLVVDDATAGGPGVVVGRFTANGPTAIDGWADPGGVHVFLRTTDGPALDPSIDGSSVARFEARLRGFLRRGANHDIRFLWVDRADGPVERWRTSAIRARQDDVDPTMWTTTAAANIEIRNYQVVIGDGTAIEPLGQGPLATFRFHHPGSGRHRPRFAAEHGRATIAAIDDGSSPEPDPDLDPSPDDDPELDLRLDLGGPLAGCLRFRFGLDKERGSHTSQRFPTRPASESGPQAAPAFGYPGLAALDLGFRFFFPDPDVPEPTGHHYLASHRYDLVDHWSSHRLADEFYPERLRFSATIDPLQPFDPGRSNLRFLPPWRDGLPSGYRTMMGHTVHLAPLTSARTLGPDGPEIEPARLLFTPVPALAGDEPSASAPLHLAPVGGFEILVPIYGDENDAAPASYNLICGLSGLEYVKVLVGDQTDPAYLDFEAGCPAYGPGYASIGAVVDEIGPTLERFAGRRLPPDTTDLDMEIAGPSNPDGSGGLDIDLGERRQILDLLTDYFPPGFRFEPADESVYETLTVTEDLIDWVTDARGRTPVTSGGDDGGDGSWSAVQAGATTSWGYVRSRSGAVYYAQPDQAVLHAAEASSSRFLDYMEVPSIGLPAADLDDEAKASLEAATGLSAQSFPLLPYGSVDSNSLADLARLEAAVINPFRRDRVQQLAAATDFATPLGTPPSGHRTGATPQGLVATYDESYETITELRLAQYQYLGENHSLALLDIGERSFLKAAIQSSQLFMVASDPSQLPLPDSAALAIEKWKFLLGPDHWDKLGTILVFKFVDQPLLDLVADPSRWSFPSELNTDPEATATTLVDLLQEAVANGQSPDVNLARKYRALARAATEPNWTGILAFNVDVPPEGLPPELLVLAAGIDNERFGAHHLGIEVTPVRTDGTTLTTDPSSLFGLIDYANPELPLPGPDGYNIHVPFLSVVFLNTEVISFAAEVLLIADRWFDERSVLLDSPDGRNVVRLKGTSEQHDGQTTYAFGFEGSSRFALSGHALEEVEFTKVQLVTDPIIDLRASPLPVAGRFLLWASMRFAYRPELDVLSFGPVPEDSTVGESRQLSASNLQVSISFSIEKQTDPETGERTSTVTNRRIGFDPSRVSFDLERSTARAQSLFTKFPLKLTGLRRTVGDPTALERSGFMPVTAPNTPDDLGEDWYGLTYDLKLGTLGALAGSAGLVVSLLTAWRPGEPGVYVGLKFPGSTGGKREIPIQGIAKIAFGSIELLVYRPGPGSVADPALDTGDPATELPAGYVLKLKNIELKLFILSLPPSGQTELTLFGDTRDGVARDERLLGWYGSYSKLPASEGDGGG